MSKPGLMRHMPQIAHVDVNCFYASAERAFNPALEGRPVIVLSNNDGCAVTRSPEAKALGIAMGEPCGNSKLIWPRVRRLFWPHPVGVPVSFAGTCW